MSRYVLATLTNVPPAGILFAALLALVSAVLAPVVVLAVVVLLPFSDRPTQFALVGSWASYLAFVGAVVLP